MPVVGTARDQGSTCRLTCFLWDSNTRGGRCSSGQALLFFPRHLQPLRGGTTESKRRTAQSVFLHALASTCCVSELTVTMCVWVSVGVSACVKVWEHVCVSIVLCVCTSGAEDKEGN